MEVENYCLVCGYTSPNDNSNETNTTLFVTSQEFRTVFQCLLKLFEVGDPPWFEKAFVFCFECTRMLTVVSELEQVLKEVEKRLKESEQVVKDRLKGSEVKFEKSGVYQRDQRYWKVRGPFISKEKESTEVGLPPSPPSLTATPQEIALEMEVINVGLNPSVAELYFNEADDDHDLEEQPIVESPAPASQQKRMTRSSTRSRNPPRRFNPDADEPKRKKRFPEHGNTISDELEEEHDVKPETSSSAQSCDPISFAQQLEGGVVEYIKVEVDPPSLDTDEYDDRFEVDDEDTSSASESYSKSVDCWENKVKNTRTCRGAAAAVTKQPIPQMQKILPPPVKRFRPVLPRPPPPGATECDQTGQTLLVVDQSGNPISSKEIRVLQPSSASSIKPTPTSTPRQIRYHGVVFKKLQDRDDCRYQCSICSLNFPVNHKLLRNHEITMHKNENQTTDLNLMCEVGEKSFQGLDSSVILDSFMCLSRASIQDS